MNAYETRLDEFLKLNAANARDFNILVMCRWARTEIDNLRSNLSRKTERLMQRDLQVCGLVDEKQNLQVERDLFQRRWKEREAAATGYFNENVVFRNRAEMAEADLRSVDAVMARRPALDVFTNRIDKILHAIGAARDGHEFRARVEKAAASLEEKDKRIETLTRWNNNAARLRDEAEAALCRAVNLIRRGYCSTVTEDDLKGILPDTAIPCPHEADAKMHKERCELEQIRYEGISGANEELRAENRRYLTALRRIAGELGEFADADGETMVKKIRFFRDENRNLDKAVDLPAEWHTCAHHPHIGCAACEVKRRVLKATGKSAS